MVHSLYARLLAFTSLLLVVGGFLFWLLAVKLDVPEPASLIVVCVICLILAAVVIGVILHPVDEVHQALVRLGAGEEVPLPKPRADDMRPLVNALEQLHKRLEVTALPGPAGLGTNAALLGVLNSLSEGVAILDSGLKIVVINTSLRSMANIDGLGADTASNNGDGLEKYRNAFNSRCFVPDQLAVIEDEMRKKPDQPRTDIIQLEHPQQFI